MGSNKLPRFSCAAHKLNIAVRTAIKSSKSFSRILKTLSQFESSIHSISLSTLHLNKKCQVRCENATRWGSSFLMLSSFIRAYNLNVFSDDHPCPIPRDVIENYYQILYDVYDANLHLQKNESVISEVIPLIITLIEGKLKRMSLYGEPKKFCDLLIKAIYTKFHYELNCDYYKVASLLDV